MPALLLSAALLTAGGCGEPPHPESGSERPTEDGGGVVSVIDAAGVRHTLSRPARRVISLVPSATETLRALGAGDVLVGRTDYDDQEWLASVPSVGGGLEPSLEAVVALRPDVVIRFEGDQDPRTPARLDELGIRHVGVRPVRLDDIFTTNRIVGTLVGKGEAAEALSQRIRAGLDSLAHDLEALPRRRVAYVLGGSPPWVAGRDTYISDILERIGADNAFADLGTTYFSVSPEELRAGDIDVVLVSARGAYERSWTPDARIEIVEDAFEVPGPRVVGAARKVAEIIHGRLR